MPTRGVRARKGVERHKRGAGGGPLWGCLWWGEGPNAEGGADETLHLAAESVASGMNRQRVFCYSMKEDLRVAMLVRRSSLFG